MSVSVRQQRFLPRIRRRGGKLRVVNVRRASLVLLVHHGARYDLDVHEDENRGLSNKADPGVPAEGVDLLFVGVN